MYYKDRMVRDLFFRLKGPPCSESMQVTEAFLSYWTDRLYKRQGICPCVNTRPLNLPRKYRGLTYNKVPLCVKKTWPYMIVSLGF